MIATPRHHRSSSQHLPATAINPLYGHQARSQAATHQLEGAGPVILAPEPVKSVYCDVLDVHVFDPELICRFEGMPAFIEHLSASEDDDSASDWDDEDVIVAEPLQLSDSIDSLAVEVRPVVQPSPIPRSNNPLPLDGSFPRAVEIVQTDKSRDAAFLRSLARNRKRSASMSIKMTSGLEQL